ncbi:alpha/beta hydrolase [Ruania rhizosphaerae]|uniref:alpha/beta hydrolase n=1 Tax=Ruania rhizosphaerae TaxID=1840413 RepID=UPI0013581CD9|nr:alpha/beta hydrolase [Ruania rhizosphaerae]
MAEQVELVSPHEGFPLLALDGSEHEMGHIETVLGDRHDDLSYLQGLVSSLTSLDGKGDAIESLRSDAVELLEVMGPVLDTITLLKLAMSNYREAFEAADPPIRRLVEEVREAHAAAEAAEAAHDETTTAADASDEVLDAARAERATAAQMLAELWEDYERVFGTWDESYEQALDSFAVTMAIIPGSDPALAVTLRDVVGGDPAEVAEAWDALSDAERAALLREYPEIMGNLEGIPYDQRAEANERSLLAALATDPEDPELVAIAQAVLKDRQLERFGISPIDGESGSLISFQPRAEEQALAAVAYGDVAGASQVNMLVPGMNSSVTDLPTWGGTAQDFNSDLAGQHGMEDVATIAWFGYDSPSEVEEPWMGRADDGASRFTSFLNGLNVEAPDASVSVVAHSYGSTTAASAIGSDPDNLGVDQFITIGSAGFDESIADNLGGVDVFATRADGDNWALVGSGDAVPFAPYVDPLIRPYIIPYVVEVPFVPDPGFVSTHTTRPEDISGTVEFESDGENIGGEHLTETPGHSTHDSSWASDGFDQNDQGYLVPGTESYYNITHIIATGTPGT